MIAIWRWNFFPFIIFGNFSTLYFRFKRRCNEIGLSFFALFWLPHTFMHFDDQFWYGILGGSIKSLLHSKHQNDHLSNDPSILYIMFSVRAKFHQFYRSIVNVRLLFCHFVVWMHFSVTLTYNLQCRNARMQEFERGLQGQCAHNSHYDAGDNISM